MNMLRELYQQVIIDHSKAPRNFGQLANANHIKEGFNPLCGDKLTVYVKEKNGVIEQMQFEGSGCAISMASASLMSEALIGKNFSEIEKIFAQFHLTVTEGKHLKENAEESLGKLSVLAGVAEFPARVKCATLAWHTLKAAIHNETQPVSTE